ncbi:hypothetical protein V6N13_133284 [Hibiscus sabdariffa]
MASTTCFLHHHALTTSAARSPQQRLVANPKPNQLPVCSAAQKQADHDDSGSKAAISRRLVLTLLIGAAAVGSKVSPADAAYGEAANVFGKPKTNTDFRPYNGEGFKLSIPSKWNPSKEVEYPGQVLRYEDNFDSTTNVAVMVTPTDKKSISDFGSPEQFLSKVDYLLGKQAYSGLTDAEGGFDSNAVATANILETSIPVIDGKKYYFLSVLTRTADGDEGGKHQLISATVNGGKLYICKAQAGDKRATFIAACKPRLPTKFSLFSEGKHSISPIFQMALETATPPATPSARVVGNAFVEQYYHILYNTPELAHRFYHDSSVLSWPDSNGVMTSVTTMQGINEKILSLDYKNYKAEINTADAQKSYKEGVTVLVTGCLTGKDNLKRNFAQSFFLAPQDNGYFVLNDVLRYVEDSESLENQKVNGVYEAPIVPSAAEHEPTRGMDPSATDAVTALVEENQIVAEQVSEPSDQERQLVNEKEALPLSQSRSNSNDIPVVVESASSAQEDTRKKSYASIVKVPKGSSGPTKVYVPTNSSRVMPQKTESQSPVSAAPAPPEASAPSGINDPENNNIPEEVEGHSIYIKNLPFNVMPAQLEQEFKKFGPIKHGGVQVRNNKQQGYCFGFVEFLSLSSMNDAIQLGFICNMADRCLPGLSVSDGTFKHAT